MEEKKERSTFDRVDFVITTLVKWVSYIGAAALFFIAVISTINVIATKVFNSPISNVTELVTYMNVPIVFFCIGYVQLDHGHTHIDLIYSHFPPLGQKIVHLVGYVIGVFVCGFAGYRGMVLCLDKMEEMTYASGPSSFLIWPFVLCIGLGYLILAISFAWSIPRELCGRSVYALPPQEADEDAGTEGA